MRSSLVALIAVLAIASASRGGTPAPGYTDTLVVGGLTNPTGIAFLPDGRLLITEKGGFSGAQNAAVKLFDGVGTTTLGTIPVCAASEMGLLGVAVDPATFASTGFIYLYRTESDGGCTTATGRSNEVVRVTMSGSTIGSLSVLLTGMRTDGGNHDGGGVRFNSSDGKLYVGVGDTGNGDNVGCPGTSTNPYSQDLSALEGKILRLNVDGSVPGDNPFVGVMGARGEIFARGFRNPFRFNFDPVTGKLWLGDVGDLAIEEVDIVSAGGNYAWPHCEATQPTGCEQPGDTDPIFFYYHSTNCSGVAPFLGSSITGGSFAGAGLGADAGSYFFGDFTGNAVYRLQPNGPRDGITGGATTIVTSAAGPVDVVTGPDGAIYYLAISAGEVRRLGSASVSTTTNSTTTSTTSTTLVAASSQLLSGKRLLLKDNADPTKKKLSVRSKDITVDLGGGDTSADDPVVNGGSLRVRTTDGCGGPCDTVYPLPNAGEDGWSYVGQAGDNRGYRYKSKTGVIRQVLVKAGKLLKVNGKGALGHELAADPSPVDVTVQTGARQYCLEYGGTTSFKVDAQFVAKDAPTAPACAP
jgi:glucose/arabinose dehydrogenase